MSVEKFAKHQTSSKPMFVVSDPVTKEILFTANSLSEYNKKKEEYFRTTEINNKT